MVVLSAIGRFFKKIWDWIKQTAWIQPLLIVGIIFGVIFSIPSIVQAIEKGNEKKNSAEVYYSQFQYSLDGGASSKADKLTKSITQGTMTDDKFFLVFIDEGNSKGADAKGGFQVLQSKFNSDEFKTNDNKPFKMITIFTDQKTSETTDEHSAFYQYLDRNEDFFIEAGSRAFEFAYHTAAKKTSDSDINNMIDIDSNSFPKPTIMLIEKTVSEELEGRGYSAGVTEVMFGVEGTTDYQKAQTLLDCWNHEGDFNYLD